jgi:acyl-CoA synthetase (AMP-forming)/AMP-acid ligase II
MAESPSLLELLTDAFARHGARVAVREPGSITTYEELWDAAGNVATRLAGEVGSGRSVGILGQRSHDAYVALLAVWRSGNAALPLQRSHPPALWREAVSASRTSHILIADQRVNADAFSGTASAVSVRAACREKGSAALPANREANALCYRITSSGTTAAPKAIPIHDRNVVAFLRHSPTRVFYEPGALVSQTFDLSFDVAFGEILQTWLGGAALCPIGDDERWDLPRYFARVPVHLWYSTPSLVKIARDLDRLGECAAPNLRRSCFIGESLHRPLAAAWAAAFPATEIWNLYGPAECTVSVAAHRWDPASAHDPVPLGRLHEEHRAHIHAGELSVEGPQVFAGYAGGASTGAIFRTGDLVEQDADGVLYFRGRADWCLKIAGQRVECEQVEDRLRQILPHAAAVVLPAFPDEFGDATGLVAVLDRPPGPNAGEALRRLAEVLPPAFVPKQFFHVEGFPLTAHGKTDRRRLLELLGEHRLRAAADPG